MFEQILPANRKTLWADLGLFYAAAIWGSTFYLVKDALQGIDPVVMVAWRFLLAGAILLIYLLIRRRPIHRGIGRAALLALILGLLYITQTIGLKFTTASNSGFITGLFVAFVPIFLLTIFKRRPTLMETIASAVALAGLWILTGGLKGANAGDMLTLVAAMMYALHLLLSDKYMKAGVDPLVISCQQFLLVGLMSLVYALIFRLPIATISTASLRAVIFLALFPSLSAFVIQMMAQRITSPLKVSLIFSLEPVFAGIFAWTLGGESVTPRGIVGGVVIFAALILSGLPVKARPTSKNK
jgi:drug/metabolite transporter (DMT)-like permease